MRVWIDLANSPHVPLMGPVVRRLADEGHDALITARDHAQTVELARRCWPDVQVVGGPSPPGGLAKGRAVAARARALARIARAGSPDVAFSHGSYAQVLAATATRVPSVVMMDYEHQPANHLSFRLARRVIVPTAFPPAALRRLGARPAKVVRYPGYKEELYADAGVADGAVLEEVGIDPAHHVVAVLRPPPEGALYHRMVNRRFEEVLALVAEADAVRAVLLARTPAQASRYRGLSPSVIVPTRAVDALPLLALADLVVGAGGTMTREAAVLGTPAYTVFAGRLAAVDAELMRRGRLRDLRAAGSAPALEKKARTSRVEPGAGDRIVATVLETLRSVGDGGRPE